ncbi:receptor-like protein Cf-9 homolog [Diospyros lotus]|uniref:receptor-like protein Cf-9 homolog n=1 Tax=Diospyros lotus TaxID=55363 RepID=UPI00224ECB4B|nr:receptor-like protein Cf-9 homolog [Diospyros lotus]
MDSSCNRVSVFLLYLICFFHMMMMMLTFTTCSDAAMVAAQMEVEEVEMKMRRCSAEQSAALLEFKSYFNFSQSAPSYCLLNSQSPMGSWKEGTDCCSLWDGITCDNETGQVVGIDLSCGWLQGNIPPNTTVFHHFPHLQELYLDFNDFGGSRIPSSFGHLSRLTHLKLQHSGFSGEIPMELSYLTQLMHLNLASNDGLRFKKTGFQLLVQNLTKIRELHLSSINISSTVPISLLNLTSSNTLVLHGCELHGQLPDGVFNLPYLEVFDVGFNSLLTGNFPKFINWSNSLKGLQLEFTSFVGQLPDSIGNLGSLEWLNAAQCNIYGAIPLSLGNLTSVMGIYLSNNSLSGPLPSQLTGLPNLQLLVLNHNCITGPLPSRFAGLPKLKFLVLDHNYITGTISPGLFALPSLYILQLSYNIFTGRVNEIHSNSLGLINLQSNKLTGTLGSSMFKVEFLTHLIISSNNFSGDINMPCSQNFLKVLGVSNNGFSGVIPKCVGNLNELVVLDLGSNNFSGIVPDTFVRHNHLETIKLNGNGFQGPVPKSLVNCRVLEVLDLGRNNFSEKYPHWLENLTNLRLNHNMLTGHVNEINSSSLKFINLEHNTLTGTLGSSTFKLEVLTHLIISSNNFSGDLNFDMLCSQNALRALDVSNNNFSGVIPKCVGNLNELVVLDLGSNNFSGIVPDTFVRHNHLETIKLNGNGFQGPVPKSLVNCTYLSVLDLGRNNFSDKYPHWLENLTNLRVLTLRANRFHGPISISKTKYPFPSLRVMDLSENCFTGPLPTTYFRNFTAMMNISEANYTLEYIGQNTSDYYLDSLTMVIKGSVLEMERVLTIFIAIDLSRNKFEGEIPEIIGKLTSVRGLNLSHNSLTGRIPKSLGKLTKIEWLDLSSNKLVGEIPKQLTALNSLGVLNLSHNQLAGRIPQGPQFDTFSNDSYVGNLGLCGRPMSKSCSNPDAPQPAKEKDSQSSDGFDWGVILSGYGCGLVLGLVIGYLMFSTGKPRGVMRMIEGAENKCREWQKKKSQGQGRKCRRNYGRH